MNRLLDLVRVEDVVCEFMCRRETLAIRMMKGVNADDAITISYICHTGQILFERCILKDDVAGFNDALHRDRRRLDTKLANDGSGCFPGSRGIRPHDPAFVEPRCASALVINSLI